MNQAQTAFLMRTSPRYIWWEPPEEAVALPGRLIARIMDIGLLEDIRELLVLFSTEELVSILRCAEVGQFRNRSWHFWHYYLTDCALGEVPPIPRKRILHA